MNYLLIFFAFFPAIGLAQVEFSPSQEILMRGKNCTELNRQAQSILDWSNLTSKQDVTLPECFCSSKSCQMDVAPISPYFVKDVTNFKSGFELETAYAGPNCFNSALVSAGALSHITFTHPLEMTEVLNSPLCKERGVSEKLQAGDILVVRDQSQPMFEIHAAVYINDELSFSKYGESNLMPYAYGLNVHKTYGVKDDTCKRVVGAPRPGDRCYKQAYVNVFSCRAMYTLISQMTKLPAGINESVRLVYAWTSSHDLKISGIANGGDKITVDQLQKTQADLMDLYEQSGVLVRDPSLSKENRSLIRLMHVHIFSLFEQTRRIAKGLSGSESLVQAQLAPPDSLNK